MESPFIHKGLSVVPKIQDASIHVADMEAHCGASVVLTQVPAKIYKLKPFPQKSATISYQQRASCKKANTSVSLFLSDSPM